MADHGLTGVLLVGGASTRFGSPKALAIVDGETLAARAWRLLGETCDERIAVGKHADGLELPFELIDDGTEIRAPIAGVIAGLRAAKTDVAVVIPVDVPLLTHEALLALAGACRDVAIPPSGPLPGAYRQTALRPLSEPSQRVGSLSGKRSPVSTWQRSSSTRRLLVNVNTQADVRRL